MVVNNEQRTKHAINTLRDGQTEHATQDNMPSSTTNNSGTEYIVSSSTSRAWVGTNVHRPTLHQSLIMLPPRFRGTATGNPLNKPATGRFRGTPGARGANDADFPCRREKLHEVAVGGALLVMPRLPIRSVILLPGVASTLMLIPPRNGDNIDDCVVVVVSCANCEGFGAVENEAVVLSGEVKSSPSEGGDNSQPSCFRFEACRGFSCQASCGRGVRLEAAAPKAARPSSIITPTPGSQDPHGNQPTLADDRVQSSRANFARKAQNIRNGGKDKTTPKFCSCSKEPEKMKGVC